MQPTTTPKRLHINEGMIEEALRFLGTFTDATQLENVRKALYANNEARQQGHITPFVDHHPLVYAAHKGVEYAQADPEPGSSKTHLRQRLFGQTTGLLRRTYQVVSQERNLLKQLKKEGYLALDDSSNPLTQAVREYNRFRLGERKPSPKRDASYRSADPLGLDAPPMEAFIVYRQQAMLGTGNDPSTRIRTSKPFTNLAKFHAGRLALQQHALGATLQKHKLVINGTWIRFDDLMPVNIGSQAKLLWYREASKLLALRQQVEALVPAPERCALVHVNRPNGQCFVLVTRTYEDERIVTRSAIITDYVRGRSLGQFVDDLDAVWNDADNARYYTEAQGDKTEHEHRWQLIVESNRATRKDAAAMVFRYMWDFVPPALRDPMDTLVSVISSDALDEELEPLVPHEHWQTFMLNLDAFWNDGNPISDPDPRDLRRPSKYVFEEDRILHLA